MPDLDINASIREWQNYADMQAPYRRLIQLTHNHYTRWVSAGYSLSTFTGLLGWAGSSRANQSPIYISGELATHIRRHVKYDDPSAPVRVSLAYDMLFHVDVVCFDVGDPRLGVHEFFAVPAAELESLRQPLSEPADA